MGPLAHAPAVVATAAARRFVVGLLPRPLPDVGHQHRTGTAARRRVEAELPGIPPAEAPDLGSRQAGVSGRDHESLRVPVGNIDIDAQDLPEQLVRVLRVVLRISAATTVSPRDIHGRIRRILLEGNRRAEPGRVDNGAQLCMGCRRLAEDEAHDKSERSHLPGTRQVAFPPEGGRILASSPRGPVKCVILTQITVRVRSRPSERPRGAGRLVCPGSGGEASADKEV